MASRDPAKVPMRTDDFFTCSDGRYFADASSSRTWQKILDDREARRIEALAARRQRFATLARAHHGLAVVSQSLTMFATGNEWTASLGPIEDRLVGRGANVTVALRELASCVERALAAMQGGGGASAPEPPALVDRIWMLRRDGWTFVIIGDSLETGIVGRGRTRGEALSALAGEVSQAYDVTPAGGAALVASVA